MYIKFICFHGVQYKLEELKEKSTMATIFTLAPSNRMPKLSKLVHISLFSKKMYAYN